MKIEQLSAVAGPVQYERQTFEDGEVAYVVKIHGTSGDSIIFDCGDNATRAKGLWNQLRNINYEFYLDMTMHENKELMKEPS